MDVAITGASGFVGRRLTERLRLDGHTTRAVSLRAAPRPEDFAGCEAVVHLAGEPVGQRWTDAAKQRIMQSRVEGTRALVAALRDRPPNVMVSASGIGYYGSRADDVLTEREPPGSDFLAQVCIAWEREAQKLDARVVPLRIGMVLGAGGGALRRMLTPFRLGLGGRIGSGRQWMSWIHIDDLCDLILFVLKESTLRRVLNATSPHPVTNVDFTRALAYALQRPAFLPVPPFPLKAMFGEMAEMLLASQRAVPEAATLAGFEFRYPDIGGTLLKIFGT